jgi:hypothetical protein
MATQAFSIVRLYHPNKVTFRDVAYAREDKRKNSTSVISSHHPRVGAGSALRIIPRGIIRRICDLAWPVRGGDCDRTISLPPLFRAGAGVDDLNVLYSVQFPEYGGLRKEMSLSLVRSSIPATVAFKRGNSDNVGICYGECMVTTKHNINDPSYRAGVMGCLFTAAVRATGQILLPLVWILRANKTREVVLREVKGCFWGEGEPLPHTKNAIDVICKSHGSLDRAMAANLADMVTSEDSRVWSCESGYLSSVKCAIGIIDGQKALIEKTAAQHRRLCEALHWLSGTGSEFSALVGCLVQKEIEAMCRQLQELHKASSNTKAKIAESREQFFRSTGVIFTKYDSIVKAMASAIDKKKCTSASGCPSDKKRAKAGDEETRDKKRHKKRT